MALGVRQVVNLHPNDQDRPIPEESVNAYLESRKVPAGGAQ